MDANPAAANGFDAALKALEDLETSVVEAREDKPAASKAPAPEPINEPVGVIGLSDAEPEGEPAAITAVPIDELEAIVAAAVHDAEPHAPVVEAPAPVIAAAAPPAGKFGKIAVGLALFSSLLSAIGLVVAERTIVSAQLVVADARERARQFEQANEVIHDLEALRAKQIQLLQAQQAQLKSAPVSSAELQAKMDALQTSLITRDPLNTVTTAIREAQADTNSRFNEFGMKISRLESAAEGH